MDNVFYIIAVISLWKVIISMSRWISDHLIRLFNIFFSNYSDIALYRTIIEINFNEDIYYRKIRIGFFEILVFFEY